MRSRIALGIMVLVLLTACGGADDAASDVEDQLAEVEDVTDFTEEAQDVEDAGPGNITFGDRTFTFTPVTCWVSEQDSEVNGPGREEGGDVVYVDFSGDGAGEGGVRIELGTDQPFDTTEHHISAERHVTEPLAVTIDGLSVSASGVFVDEHGEEHPGQLSFACD